MSPRTRILLVILLLSSSLFLWLNVDWSKPVTLYRNYRHVQALLQNKESLLRAEQLLKDEFGENTSLSYNVSIDLNGAVSMKIQARRTCGDPDGKRYLETAIRRVHEVGLGWPDQIEYLYSCGFTKPPSFKLTAQTLAQALEQRVTEHSMCRDLSWGPYSLSGSTAQQSIRVTGGAVDMKLLTDEDGNVVKVQWTPAWGVNSPEPQYRLMLCMTYALLRTVQPDWTDGQVKAGWHDVWRSSTGPDSVRIERFTFDTKTKPLELVVYPSQ